MSDHDKPQTQLQEKEAVISLKGCLDIEKEEYERALAAYVPDTEAEKKLVRKIDLFLLPCLWIMYVMNYIDRTNIGNAKIAGMDKALALDDSRKSLAASRLK